MKTLSFWKKSVYSALVFFGTLMVLSVGYAIWNSAMGSVNSGSPLTANGWNALVDNITDLNNRWSRVGSDIAFTGGNVGIGTTSPWYKLDITGDIRLSGKLHTNAVWILTTATSLGININGGGYGGVALLMCSRNHAAGNNTYAALYMLRYGYDGNNYSTSLVSGTDFIAFSIDGSGNLFASQNGGNATCSVFTNK